MICACVDHSLVVVALQTVDENDPIAVNALAAEYFAIVDVASVFPTPAVGWTMVNGKLVGPNTTWIITRLAFRQRFTNTEKTTIYAFAYGPSTSAYAYAIQGYLEDLAASTFIDLQRPDTAANLGQLVLLGLLTSARVNVILTTPPTQLELYHG